MQNCINIISFDTPFPPNYGGVIDVYYKLVWLKKTGFKIYLHCFTKNKKSFTELDLLCEEVFYYERKTSFIQNLSVLPYNIKSRSSDKLVQNLLANNYPILCEVLHTCFFMQDKRLKNRIKIYRHSNIEHNYYKALSKSERNLFKKIYFLIEAYKLYKFESILNNFDLILCVNSNDFHYFKQKYPTKKLVYLPSFHPNNEFKFKIGKGDFILFHGNLSVSENYDAAVWLIENVFSKINIKCVVAGLNPPIFLINLIKKYNNIQLFVSPTDNELNNLIYEAQINVLYTKQTTGLKLKLLNVLFNGRFLICNKNMITGTNINHCESIRICYTSEQYINTINQFFDKQYDALYSNERKIMTSNFDNHINIIKLTNSIFN